MAVFSQILYENYMKLNYKNWQLICFVSLRYEWKKRRAHFRMAGYSRHTMCTSVFFFFFFFSLLPQGNEKNQQSILKWYKQVFTWRGSYGAGGGLRSLIMALPWEFVSLLTLFMRDTWSIQILISTDLYWIKIQAKRMGRNSTQYKQINNSKHIRHVQNQQWY